MWIGSRTCRYQGLADVVLYGNRADMDNHDMVGRKYLWTGSGGTLEMHGKDKKSWTKLNEHLFKDSVAVEKLSWYQTRWQDTYMGNRFVVHVLRLGSNSGSCLTYNLSQQNKYAVTALPVPKMNEKKRK